MWNKIRNMKGYQGQGKEFWKSGKPLGVWLQVKKQRSEMIQFTLLLFLFYHLLILQMRSQGTQRFSDLPKVIQLLSGISSEPNNSRFYAMLFSVFPCTCIMSTWKQYMKWFFFFFFFTLSVREYFFFCKMGQGWCTSLCSTLNGVKELVFPLGRFWCSKVFQQQFNEFCSVWR